MYLIEGTQNQSHQANIDYIHGPSDTEMFMINSTIQPVHINTKPKTSVTTICFGTHYHTPETTTVYPTSPVDQRLQRQFEPATNGFKCTA